MLIKLQADQVAIFWDSIRDGIALSCKIPDKFKLDFSIAMLEEILSGNIQVWMGYSGEVDNKTIEYFITTKIYDSQYHGLRTLVIESLYSLSSISSENLNEIKDVLETYAIENKCDVVVADYYNERVKQFLLSTGFETYKSSARIFIRR